MPESFTKGPADRAVAGESADLLRPQYRFKTFGKSGQQICELFPHIGSVADDICIIRSMQDRADQSRSGAHADEHRVDHRGAAEHGIVDALRAGRGDGGSAGFRGAAVGGQGRPDAADRGAAMVGGILPSKFQGVKLNSFGDPVLYITTRRA
jgi:hypothetical protein